MFGEDFNTEGSIRKWASVIRACGVVFAGLCALAALILLSIEAYYYWWIALTCLGGGGLTLLGAFFSSAVLWGFADIVANTKRIASGTPKQQINVEEMDLPEL
jgi:hypothetical protein